MSARLPWYLEIVQKKVGSRLPADVSAGWLTQARALTSCVMQAASERQAMSRMGPQAAAQMHLQQQLMMAAAQQQRQQQQMMAAVSQSSALCIAMNHAMLV